MTRKITFLVLLMLTLLVGCSKSYVTRPEVPPAPADTTDCPDRDDDDKDKD